jgi:hypothetical protein
MDEKSAITLEQALAEAQKNRRVCPVPQRWQELYEMLPNKQRAGSEWEPPPPLILAAWWGTPALAKTVRFREHLEWAETQGCLDRVFHYLSALQEKDWHHLGD